MFVGCRILIAFAGHGIFAGMARSYDKSAKLFEVAYTNDDREDLNLGELQALLLPSSLHGSASSSSSSSSAASPPAASPTALAAALGKAVVLSAIPGFVISSARRPEMYELRRKAALATDLT